MALALPESAHPPPSTRDFHRRQRHLRRRIAPPRPAGISESPKAAVTDAPHLPATEPPWTPSAYTNRTSHRPCDAGALRKQALGCDHAPHRIESSRDQIPLLQIARGCANVGIALVRDIDRANQGFPLSEVQWAEDAPTRKLRGAYPRPAHPRYETADLGMIRLGI